MDLAALTYPELGKADYDLQLAQLQSELVRLQLGLYRTNHRAVIAVEGTDAAGKGGFVRRLISNMDPRGYRVYPIGAPSADESSRHYLQRFWRRIPQHGQLAIFDRSWYGRVLIERVEKLSPEADWRRAFRELNEFEKLLTDDGIILVKLFFSIDQQEQLRRFTERFENPNKRWKITEADIKSREFRADYQVAYQEMLDRTSTDTAPWHVIAGNNKYHARIAAMQAVRDGLAREIDVSQIELIPADLEKRIRDVLYD